MKRNITKLIVSLALPIGVGFLASVVSGGMGSYLTLAKPPLSPPGWLFPIVWSALYLLMGYAAYRIWVSAADTPAKRRALVLYGVQLLLNFFWPVLFFGFGWYLSAFILLLLLWLAIFVTMRLFAGIDPQAGDLLLPYLLWVTFAGYLNLGIYFLN